MRARSAFQFVVGPLALLASSRRQIASQVARRSPAALLALALAACGDDDGPTDPADLRPCTGPVTVSVSGGTAPTFGWTPACAVRELLVEDGGVDVWLVESPNGIAPGVRYGSVPVGATQRVTPEALAPGTQYDVILFADTAFDAQPIAVQSFMP